MKPYLPFIIPLVVALIAYFFGQRTNKINRFYTQVENSLKTIIEPLFLNISDILTEDDDGNREAKIEKLFETHFLNNNVASLGNVFLIRSFIELEKEYKNYKKHRTEKHWSEFWIALQLFYNMIEDEYWKNICSLYRDYKWYQNNLTTNFFFRFWNELIRMMNESLKFISLVLCFSVTFAFYEFVLAYFFNQKRFLPDGSLKLSFTLFIVVILTMTCLSMLSTLSPQIQRRKINFIEKI
jgi:hypothetical protein